MDNLDKIESELNQQGDSTNINLTNLYNKMLVNKVKEYLHENIDKDIEALAIEAVKTFSEVTVSMIDNSPRFTSEFHIHLVTKAIHKVSKNFNINIHKKD